MDKNRYLKIDHVSEINIIIETMQYYKHNNMNKPILDEDLDVLLSVCLELQKLFCKWGLLLVVTNPIKISLKNYIYV